MLVTVQVYHAFIFIVIQGAVVCSANMLLCSDSWCNDNDNNIDFVQPGRYVQYVCQIDNSISLKWDISSSEDRTFLNIDPIGQTLVADNTFFFTLIDNVGSLVSSLSFNVTENLNKTKIFCVDQSNVAKEIELIIPSSKIKMYCIVHVHDYFNQLKVSSPLYILLLVLYTTCSMIVNKIANNYYPSPTHTVWEGYCSHRVS